MPTSVNFRSAQATPASGHEKNSRCETYSSVVVVGAGIVGLTNALQFAKRGLTVTLVDNVESRKDS